MKRLFWKFGGRYVSETLMPLIIEVKRYEKVKNEKIIDEFNHYLKLMLEGLVHYFLLKILRI